MKTIQSARSHPVTHFSRASLVCGAICLIAGCATQPESHVTSAPPPPPPTATVDTTSSPVVVTTQPATASNAATSTIIVTQTPPPRKDVPIARPDRPSSAYVWIEGFWTWRNQRYEWMSGHWAMPSTPTAQWVDPRWVKEGNGYRFYEGYWKE